MNTLLPITAMTICFIAIAALASAQEPTSRTTTQSIVLNADDKPAFPPPPAGFDIARANVPHGQMTLVEYPSKTIGTIRKMLVYTPPDYATSQTYNTLYLLHGIGGDETEWQRYCAPAEILDNLFADKKLPPMIVVFPNGRAQKEDHPPGDWFKYAPAFAAFTDELLNDVVPFVESHYPVFHTAEHRALAGFSMGGGQSLNIGLAHPEMFSYIGAFSSAPNTQPPEKLWPRQGTHSKIRLLYLSCGDEDNLLPISQKFHRYLNAHQLEHIWNVNPGGHDGETWKKDLFHFAPLLFH